jgi:hypothetical protein
MALVFTISYLSGGGRGEGEGRKLQLGLGPTTFGLKLQAGALAVIHGVEAE